MKISILTVCPEMFESFLQSHCIARAGKLGLLTVEIVDIRDYAEGSFRDVDDSPYGGGRGMLLRCEPVLKAIRAVREAGSPSLENGSGETKEGRPLAAESEKAKECQLCTDTEDTEQISDSESLEIFVAALTPAGKAFDQKKAHELAGLDHLVLLCGHYEGFDERIFSAVDEEISIGDYILSGGEIAAMAVTDAVARLLPGNLKEGSAEDESFENGLLEYPQYTHPAEYEGMKVPEVLLSGNHEAIRKWRREEALRKTAERRPDLLK